MKQTSYGLFAVISGNVLLQSASTEEEVSDFLARIKKTKGFEMVVAFDRYTNVVVRSEYAEEEKKTTPAAGKKVSQPAPKEVEGWRL